MENELKGFIQERIKECIGWSEYDTDFMGDDYWKGRIDSYEDILGKIELMEKDK